VSAGKPPKQRAGFNFNYKKELPIVKESIEYINPDTK
jgi:hypothetical protein